MPTTLMLAKVNILDKSQHLNNSKPHVCTSYSKLHELLVIVCRNILVHIEGLDNRKYVSENKYSPFTTFPEIYNFNMLFIIYLTL